MFIIRNVDKGEFGKDCTNFTIYINIRIIILFIKATIYHLFPLFCYSEIIN